MPSNFFIPFFIPYSLIGFVSRVLPLNLFNCCNSSFPLSPPSFNPWACCRVPLCHLIYKYYNHWTPIFSFIPSSSDSGSLTSYNLHEQLISPFPVFLVSTHAQISQGPPVPLFLPFLVSKLFSPPLSVTSFCTLKNEDFVVYLNTFSFSPP